jgi:hypothetical protein
VVLRVQVVPGLGGLGGDRMREEDAAFVRPVYAEEALPGFDCLAEGSHDELL